MVLDGHQRAVLLLWVSCYIRVSMPTVCLHAHVSTLACFVQTGTPELTVLWQPSTPPAPRAATLGHSEDHRPVPAVSPGAQCPAVTGQLELISTASA